MRPNIDILGEFQDPIVRPRFFKVIFGMLIVVVILNIYAISPRLYDSFFYSGIMLEDVYNPLLLIIYPLICSFGFLQSKRYGWFIFSHFSLSISLITAISIIKFIVRDEDFGNKVGILIVAQFGLNTICLFKLFSRQFLDYFGVKRDQIFAVVLVTILIPILISILSDSISF